MKNHNYLKLPLDDQLIELYKVLIEQNEKIRSHYKQDNEFLFITVKGATINGKSTNNAISKQLNKYSKRYELPNINAHAIRRAYANKIEKRLNCYYVNRKIFFFLSCSDFGKFDTCKC